MEAALSLRSAGEALEKARASGDKAAGFSAVYRLHGRAIYGTAIRMLRRPEDAEDAVQEAFLAYHRTRPRIPNAEIGKWLTRVVINGCIDRLRRRRRWETVEFEDRDAITHPVPVGVALDLQRAVARLPEKARLVFLLHDVEGMDHRELARVLRLTVGTSKSQLFRARRLLKDFLQRGPS